MDDPLPNQGITAKLINWALTCLVAVPLLILVLYVRESMKAEARTMTGKILNVDRASETFVISESGYLHEYHVNGPIPLGAGAEVIIFYKPAKHWFRFFWQDENEIQIDSVAESKS